VLITKELWMNSCACKPFVSHTSELSAEVRIIKSLWEGSLGSADSKRVRWEGRSLGSSAAADLLRIRILCRMLSADSEEVKGQRMHD
jgi:hypothetical protein